MASAASMIRHVGRRDEPVRGDGASLPMGGFMRSSPCRVFRKIVDRLAEQFLDVRSLFECDLLELAGNGGVEETGDGLLSAPARRRDGDLGRRRGERLGLGSSALPLAWRRARSSSIASTCLQSHLSTGPLVELSDFVRPPSLPARIPGRSALGQRVDEDGALADPDRADIDAVDLEGVDGILAEGAARRHRIQDDGGGLPASLARSMVEWMARRSRMAGRQGIRMRSAARAAARAAFSECGAVSMIAMRAPPSRAASSTWARRAAWAETTAGFSPSAMVSPAGGAGLRIEIDDGGRLPGLLGRDGQVEGQGCLAGPAFLRDDRDCLHVEL